MTTDIEIVDKFTSCDDWRELFGEVENHGVFEDLDRLVEIAKRNNVNKSDYIESLESALIDILDGNSAWHEVRDNTGLSEERCHEIESFYFGVLENYRRKHGLA